MEWFEQGETKGKEIDMASIESLNPEIIIPKPGEKYNIQERSNVPNNQQLEFNKLQRVSLFAVNLIWMY